MKRALQSADHQLTDLGLKFTEIAERFDRLRLSANDNPEMTSTLSAIDVAAAQMIACRSESVVGLQVKAKIALWAHGEPSDATNEPTLELKMLWSIVEDVVALDSQDGI